MKKPVGEGSAAGQKKRSANTTKQLLPADQSKSSFVALMSSSATRRARGRRGWRSAGWSRTRNDAHQHPVQEQTRFAGVRWRYEHLTRATR
jgi:hypothetical protein